MLNSVDSDRIFERFNAFWAFENHDRPLVAIRAPRDHRITEPASAHQDLASRWLDVDYQIAMANAQLQNTFYGCEALPIYNPNLGPDLFAACYGTPLAFGDDTSWALHNLREAPENPVFSIDHQNLYYRKILEITGAAVEDGLGRYLVGVTDLHPGLDALVAMRGPEQLCIDAAETPDFITNGAMELFKGFRELYKTLSELTTKHQQGTTNWMGLWHPGRWYVTSCDFSCLISPRMFEALVIPELLAELDFLDASIYHLDGPGALKHLDRLLRIDSLDGIQWVYGAGQPPASQWLEVLKKIQRSGKLIQVEVEPEELRFMLESLEPEGVFFSVNAETEAQACALVELCERFGK